MSPNSEDCSKLVPLRRVVAWGLDGLTKKLNDDVVGWEADGKLLVLERSNGCAKVNCTVFVELLPVVRGLL